MADDLRNHRENLIIEQGATGAAVATVGGAGDTDPLNNIAAAGAAINGTNRFGAVRDRLFHVMLVKMALSYSQHVSYTFRRLIEFCAFVTAFSLLGLLIYVHVTFNQFPNTCLNEIRDIWPKKGVLRVEVIHNLEEFRKLQNRMLNAELSASTVCEFDLKRILVEGPSALPADLRRRNFSIFTTNEKIKIDIFNLNQSSKGPMVSSGQSIYESDTLSILKRKMFSRDYMFGVFNIIKYVTGVFYGPLDWDDDYDDEERPSSIFSEKLAENANNDSTQSEAADYELEGDDENDDDDDDAYSSRYVISAYIVEYSLHYGLLKLSPMMRQEYGVPVMVVQLDADTNECFGDWRNRFVMRHLIGFEDVVWSSIRWLAENETEKGFLRDMISGDHYNFVSVGVSRTSYLTALLVMLIFTFAISMLLRFSHHQIFLFIVDLLQMFELNQPLVFPVAPLLTVILALVGMEAIMSEIFNDTSTAFYVILLVWIADQYDAICCQSSIGKRHWLRFFYLYHYAFYAYHYRFSGQYGGLALLTSAAFILHSMIFFFHHYEMPLIVYQEQLRRVVHDLQHSTVNDSATLNVTITLADEQHQTTTTTRPHASNARGDGARQESQIGEAPASHNFSDSRNTITTNNTSDPIGGGGAISIVTCTIQHFLRRRIGDGFPIPRPPVANPSTVLSPSLETPIVRNTSQSSAEVSVVDDEALRRAGCATADQLMQGAMGEIFSSEQHIPDDDLTSQSSPRGR